MHPSTTHLAGRTALQLLAVFAMLAALLAPMLIGSAAWANHGEGTKYLGNPSCSALNPQWVEYKIDDLPTGGPEAGDYGDPSNGLLTGPSDSLTAHYVTLSNTSGQSFDYELGADFPPTFQGVIVKGGPVAMFYDASESTTGLHAPVNPKNGQVYGLSHISFCSGPGDVAASATLTVVKAFEPAEAGVVTDYQASVDGDVVPWDVPETVAPGGYIITETYLGDGDDPLQLDGIACVDDEEVSVEYSADTGVTLADGDDVTCTLTNILVPTQPEPSSLTLLKQVINDDGGEAVYSDFVPTVKDDEGADAIEGVAFQAHDAQSITSYPIEPGTYTLGETGSDAYDLTSLTCEGGTFDSATSTLTVAEGDDVVCTFVNDDEEAEVEGVVIEKDDPAPAPDPDPAPDVESEELAQTGLDAPWLAVLSLLFLSLGTALVRRTSPLMAGVRRLSR